MSKIYLTAADHNMLMNLPSFYERTPGAVYSPFNPACRFKILPDDAEVQELAGTCMLREDLSGVIFTNGKNLPRGFKTSIQYWCGTVAYKEGMEFYQTSPYNVLLQNTPKVLTDGLVVHIQVKDTVFKLSSKEYIRCRVDGIPEYLADNVNAGAIKGAVFFLRKDDIFVKDIYLNLFRLEMSDYGFNY